MSTPTFDFDSLKLHERPIEMVAVESGTTNKHPLRLEGSRVVEWKMGVVKKDETFAFIPSSDPSDLSNEEYAAILPLWADPIEDDIYEAVALLRANPERMQQLRAAITQRRAGANGSRLFNPYSRHANPEQAVAATRLRKRAAAKLGLNAAGNVPEAEAEGARASVADKLASITPGKREDDPEAVDKIPNGVHAMREKSGWFKVSFEGEVTEVKGKAKADEALKEMTAAAAGGARLADTPPV